MLSPISSRIALCAMSLLIAAGAIACNDDSDSTTPITPPTQEDPVCGNGTVEIGEQCDDGDQNGHAGHCNTTCDGHIAKTCGNGIVETGEQCDDGGESATCNADCRTAACGDGVTNATAGEKCDDGEDNGTPNHCGTTCKGPTPSICGNGIIEKYETCDDGDDNGTPNHCATTCKAQTPSLCGNNIQEAGEDCDDGLASAACNPDCTSASCGDGVLNVSAGELCDDGGDNGTPGYCNAQCDGYLLCGNGTIDGNEVCDDGGDNGTSGHCNAECTGVGSAICGDGTTEGNEQCDDGEQTAACNANCTLSACGDGFVNTDAGEQCDTAGDSFACDANCQAKNVAFHVDTASIVDPHLYFSLIQCFDITGEDSPSLLEGGVNKALQDALNKVKTRNGQEQFRMSLALITRPLAQQLPQTSGTFEIPHCDTSLASCSRNPNPDKPVILTNITNKNTGACLPPADRPGRNPAYRGMHQPVAPCLLAENPGISIDIKGAELRLLDVQIAAHYEGQPATHLTDGVIKGFLTRENAEAASMDTDIGHITLASLLRGDGGCGSPSDLDTYNGEEGWWFYINFTATAADSWTEP